MHDPKTPLKGAIAWMVGNPVAANLLMAVCIVGGLITFGQIRQEVFPDLSQDVVSVRVAYPGGTPQELEQGVCLAVEEAVRGLDGVKEVTATAQEGLASVEAELIDGVDLMQVYQDIQSEVDRITTFPKDAERPEVSLSTRRRQTFTLILFGDTSPHSLRALAEQARERLLQSEHITQVELAGIRDFEIAIEIPQAALRRHDLTHRGVAAIIRSQAVELSGGTIKTDRGETLLRMKERRDYGSEFARVPLITSDEGTQLLVEDIGEVIDGFEESDRYAMYNGKPAILLEVYRIGDQTPSQISKDVYGLLPLIQQQLPAGIGIEVLTDRADIFSQRANLLLRNGAVGLTLVMLLLGCFLEIRLAFWVMMGVPISFLGSMLLMPLMGLSINMVTMFAYILALGIVVDDAIVVGENIYHHLQDGEPPLLAAIRGCREVAVPVTFSILTNIVAFIPLMVMPGMMGSVMSMLPLVVVSVFIISWVESMYVLPAHLAHGRKREPHGVGGWIHTRQQRFSHAFRRWVTEKYGPFLDLCLTHRYAVVGVAIALMILVSAYWKSGRLGFSMFPSVESDFSRATLYLPYGAPVEQTQLAVDRVVAGARQAVADSGHPELSKGIYANVGFRGAHTADVRVYLADPKIRDTIMGTEEFTQAWRAAVGPIVGTRFVRFASDTGGPGGGPALEIELRHHDIAVLEAAAADLEGQLGRFEMVEDIDNGIEAGKQQFDFTLRPEATALGLTSEEIARQIRSAFQGSEVLRQQRGRNEVKVRVRLPEAERNRMATLENFVVIAPSGGEALLTDVVSVEDGKSYTKIKRRNGMRTLTVTADVRPKSRAGEVMERLDSSTFPPLLDTYPGISYSYEGRRADMRDSVGSMMITIPLVLVAIYGLLAIPFRSYIQPVIVMVSIPLGIVGAVLGHMIMGYEMTMIGIIGMIALSGVVVNDALVLITFANEQRQKHATAHDAVVAAGIQRFRPIMLTTLTTFGGLAPMIFEQSRQARFLIPMAISLGYGLLFATAITLLLVPSLYMVIEDIRGGSRAKAGENHR
jgi:multidrug efflux pump subunit AcrB